MKSGKFTLPRINNKITTRHFVQMAQWNDTNTFLDLHNKAIASVFLRISHIFNLALNFGF